jgi:segregation and condensation protein B
VDDDRRESGMDSAFSAVEGARHEGAILEASPAAPRKRRSPTRRASSAEEPVVKSKRRGRGGVDPALEPIAGASSIAPESTAVPSDPRIELVPSVDSSAHEEPPAADGPREGEAARAETAAPVPLDPGAAERPEVATDDAAFAVESAAPKARRKRGRGAAPSEEPTAEVPAAPRGLEEPAEGPIGAAEARGEGTSTALEEEPPTGAAGPGSSVGLGAGSEGAAPAGTDPAEDASLDAAAEAEPEEVQGRVATGGAEFDLPVEETGLERIEDRQLLAVLFGSPEELTVPRLAEILGWKRRAVEQRLPQVKKWLDQLLLPFELRLIAGGWRLVSRSEYAELLGRLRVVRRRDRLSQAALEVLAVVAYKQPVAASEVDRIRGVSCSSILRLLLDRELVHVVGRQESPGRPLLYGTTKLFLDRFGLGALHDLPGIEIAAEGFAAASDDAEDLSREDSALDSGDEGGAPAADAGDELRGEDPTAREDASESSA